MSTIQIKKLKILIAFDCTFAHRFNKKKINKIVTELFNRHRKLNISLVFADNLMLLHQKILH